MKRLYSFAMAMGTAVLATAQLTGVSIESVLTHDDSIDPSLDGYTTYRIYADVTSSTDFVSAVFGDASNPLVLGCTGNIYQSIGVNFNYARSEPFVLCNLSHRSIRLVVYHWC